MLQFLHLPLFIPTFVAVLFRPLRFFRAYHELVKTRPGSFWDLNAEKAIGILAPSSSPRSPSRSAISFCR